MAIETLTPETLAALLNGREYHQEITREEEQRAAAAGLVVVFGASDDLLKFCGLVHDEVGAYEGTTVRLTAAGPLPDWADVDHDDERECEAYFRLKLQHSVEVKALWNRGGYSWQIETAVPHATFEVMDDGERYCRGVVLHLVSALKGA